MGSIDVILGQPVDYKKGRGSRKSHLNLSLRWNWTTRQLNQAAKSTLRVQAGETTKIPIQQTYPLSKNNQIGIYSEKKFWAENFYTANGRSQ